MNLMSVTLPCRPSRRGHIGASPFGKIRSAVAGLATLLMSGVHSNAADYSVNFDGAGETKAGYASGSVTLSGISWNMTEALIGTEVGEIIGGARTARLRGYGATAMTMLADKADGAGTISFQYRRYNGADTQATYGVEISSNGGTTWTPVGSGFTAPASSDIQDFNETVNVSGNVRFRIVCRTAGSTNRRLNLDNILITDYAGGGGPDTTPPSIVSRAPGVSETDVALDAGISITFDEPVQLGVGNVRLFRVADPSDEQISISSLNINGSTASFSPLAYLEHGETYYVLIDGDAITDMATPTPNAFPGISGETEWTFTTIEPDTAGPVATAFSPDNGAANVNLDAILTATLNEDAFPGTGDILIKRVSDNGVVAALDVTDGNLVAVFGNELILYPSSPLPFGTELYVEVPAGALTDYLSNASLAIGGPGVWQFTTMQIPPLEAETAYTQDFSAFLSSETLPDGWTVTASGSASTKYNYSAWHTAAAASIGTGIKFSASDPVTDVFGYQHTGDTGTVVQKLSLYNDTGDEITDLTIQYIGLRSRTTDIGREAYYEVSVNGGSPVAALGYDTGDGDSALRTAVVSGLSIAEDEVFTIEWTSNRAILGSGSTRQIGISSVLVSSGQALFPPTVGSFAVTNGSVTANSAAVTADVVADGGAAITQRGFVYSVTSTNSSPTLGGTGVSSFIDPLAEVGAIGTTLGGLTDSTEYSVRAFATNAEGTTYSGTLNFTTLAAPPSLVTEYLQPFDNYTGTLPGGWTAISTGNVQSYAGAWTSASTSGGFYGGVSEPGVLGYLHTGSTGLLTTTLTLINGTGSEITQLYVSYLGRVERTANTRYPAWTVTVAGEEVSGLSYSTGSGTDEEKAQLVTGLSIAPGATFTITWASDRGLNATGSSRRIGIADVRVALEEPSGGGYADWADDNAGGQTADLDFDNDGVPNGVEYFMNAAAGFTANPALVGGTVTWTNGGNIPSGEYGTTFVVQTSTNLSSWTDVLISDPNLSNTAGSVSYTPTAPAPFFVRLLVTP